MKVISYFLYALTMFLFQGLIAESDCEVWASQYIKEQGIDVEKDAST